MISLSLVKYVLLSAVRDKIILSIFLIVVLCLSLAIFLGSATLVEKDHSVTVYAAGGVRIAGIIGLILYIVFYIRRSFESRDVDFLLSRPISRLSFILSHALAFCVIASIFAGICIFAVFPFAGFITGNSFLLWSISLLMEFLIMACASMFFAMVISSAASAAIVTLAFYVLARLIGQLINIVSSYKVGSVEADPGFQIMGYLMEAISLFIPRLDLMAQTSWLLYSAEGVVGYVYVLYHGLIFSGFLISATAIDLLRRQF